MNAALLYLLQSHVTLLLFAAGWLGVRRLTFFGLNRAYLLLTLAAAGLGPALPSLPAWWRTEPLGPVAAYGWLSGLPAAPRAAISSVPWDWPQWLLAAYALGAGVLLIRLGMQVASLRRLHRLSRPAHCGGIAYRRIRFDLSPCSFGPYIYLNPVGLAPADLAAVLRHEQAHVRQWHALDVLLGHLFVALAWPNPVAWLMRRALQINLEYLADRCASAAGGLSRRAYQLSLLRLAQTAAAPPSLAISFAFSPLKTRICMLNQPGSALSQAARYLLVLPLLGTALGFGAAVAPAAAGTAQSGSGPAAAAYYIDGRLTNQAAAERLNATPNLIASVNVLDSDAARKVFEVTGAVVVITTLQNQRSTAVKALNDKIATLLAATPPPRGPAAQAPAAALPPAT